MKNHMNLTDLNTVITLGLILESITIKGAALHPLPHSPQGEVSGHLIIDLE